MKWLGQVARSLAQSVSVGRSTCILVVHCTVVLKYTSALGIRTPHDLSSFCGARGVRILGVGANRGLVGLVYGYPVLSSQWLISLHLAFDASSEIPRRSRAEIRTAIDTALALIKDFAI